MLVWGCCLIGGMLASDPLPATSDAESIACWIRKLDHTDYTIRMQATAELSQQGPEVLAPLSDVLKTGSLEQRMRAIEIVSRIYHRDEEASFFAAEQILDSVVEKAEGSLKDAAQDSLDANYFFRQRSAMAEIEKLGGRALFVQLLSAVDQNAPADAEHPASVSDELIIGLMIDRRWTGGDAGLQQVRRLTRLQTLYLDKKAPLSPEGLLALQAGLPKLIQVMRGPAYLGIRPSDPVLPDGRRACVITEVTADSAAAKAGVRPRDVILEFAGKPVTDSNGLIELIAEKEPGDKVPILVARNGEKVELEAELSNWPKFYVP